YGDHRELHSFPTRRSSDLLEGFGFVRGPGGGVAVDRGQDAGGLLAAHDADAAVGPGEQEAGRIGPAAHAVVARAETAADQDGERSEEHTSELQSRENLVCR